MELLALLGVAAATAAALLIVTRWTIASYVARFASRTPMFASERTFVDPATSSRTGFPSITEAATRTLSLVVPAYNEEERLPIMLRESIDFLLARAQRVRDFTFEIIIVDDGSKDRTTEVALRFAREYGIDRVRVMTLARNVGKGGAVRKGVSVARGERILMVDADAATKFSDIERMEAALDKVQIQTPTHARGELVGVAVGSRAHLQQQAVARRAWYRNVLMWGFHALVTTLGGVRGIRDTQCGFKLFTRRCARVLFDTVHIERWAFDVELLQVAQQLGFPSVVSGTVTPLRDMEVPVNWTEVPGSKLNVLTAAVTMARDMAVIRLAYLLRIWTPAVNGPTPPAAVGAEEKKRA